MKQIVCDNCGATVELRDDEPPLPWLVVTARVFALGGPNPEAHYCTTRCAAAHLTAQLPRALGES